MDTSPTIRKARSSDVAELSHLAERAMGPQEAISFSEEMERSRTRLWVAEGETGLLGYLLAWSVAGEAEILEVAVDPTLRRKGIGKALLARFVAEASEAGDCRLLLEVRASNLGALALYKGMGFEECGLRRNYYSKPTEDAVLMAVNLEPSLESERDGG